MLIYIYIYILKVLNIPSKDTCIEVPLVLSRRQPTSKPAILSAQSVVTYRLGRVSEDSNVEKARFGQCIYVSVNARRTANILSRSKPIGSLVSGDIRIGNVKCHVGSKNAEDEQASELSGSSALHQVLQVLL